MTWSGCRFRPCQAPVSKCNWRLQNMDKASRATEKAAEELGQASREIERAALKFQADMDKTLPEVAAASREFQELVR